MKFKIKKKGLCFLCLGAVFVLAFLGYILKTNLWNEAVFCLETGGVYDKTAKSCQLNCQQIDDNGKCIPFVVDCQNKEIPFCQTDSQLMGVYDKTSVFYLWQQKFSAETIEKIKKLSYPKQTIFPMLYFQRTNENKLPYLVLIEGVYPEYKANYYLSIEAETLSFKKLKNKLTCHKTKTFFICGIKWFVL